MRPIALRNAAKVCVFAGAPRLGVGCERWKRLVFYSFFKRLVVMVENDAFLACARCFLSLVQAKRSFRSLKAMILRRQPSNPLVHCRPCFFSEICFVYFSVSLAFSLFFRFCLSSFSTSLPFCVGALFRGRRQLPQAGEVRRPPGPACVRQWRYVFKNTMVKSKRRQGAAGSTSSSPRPPRGRFCDTSRAKWGVRGLGAGRAKSCSGAGEGASYQKSCSRLHQSMISTPHALKVAKGGGLGPRGRACEVVLWCRRGRIF